MTPANNLPPGWVNVYSSGKHGFKGRHFYNPTTGEALSVRQGQLVQRKVKTLEQALDTESTPRRTKMVMLGKSKDFAGRQYKELVFATLYGAWRWAALKSQRPSLVTAYGKPWKKYPFRKGEPTGENQWRSLFPTSDPSMHAYRGIYAYYKRYDQLFESPPVGKENAAFAVLERRY